MRRWFTATAVLTFLAGAASAGAQTPSPAAPPAGPFVAGEPLKLTPNTKVYGSFRFSESLAYDEALRKSGHLVAAHALQPVEAATTIRVRNGKLSMTDGPYAESKEIMGGFWVIDVADLDTALDWARKGSAACEGPVEVRPFQGG